MPTTHKTQVQHGSFAVSPLRPLLWLGVLSGGILLLAGCDRPQANDEATTVSASDAPVEVQGVTAWTSPILETRRYIGSTRSVDSVEVTSQVSSKVAWIGFEDEDEVEQGQELLRLDQRRAEADLRSIEARLDRLRLNLKRIESAYEAGAANLTELDDIRAVVRETEAEADRVRVVLEDHVIKAPFTGVITTRLVSLGALVQPGDAVAVLNTSDPIEISFAVPETDLAGIRQGQTVIAQFAGFADSEFRGELRTTGAEVDPTTRSAVVYAAVPNPDQRLRPGMFAPVTLVIGQRDNAILLPESALLVEGRRVEVFVIEDGKSFRRRVQIAKRYPGLVEIAEGIEPGTPVVTSGLQKLRDGTSVRFSEDRDLALLGIIPGLPLSEQPVTLGDDLPPPTPESSGG
jgi:membrane fusion protein (multidrug efflux system)